ncbi:DUF6090 family protein [Robertkochia flava]|uniref:DUF6090 family protein n=1 Tax=Robertkochia flava TaxID=3447986 RepID=UPI001CCFF22E|nr:DUF6090 family protein [Robertkochia marina]
MIAFLRKTRRQFLAKQKMSGYLKYAIGEIILVVAGILIALQINTWNEHRKERILEQKMLRELRSDFRYNQVELKRNIEKATRLVKTGDSLKVLFGKDASLVNPGDIMRLTMRLSAYATFDPSNGALNDLISSGKLNLVTNDTLRMHLSRWFGELDDVKEDEKRLINFGDRELNPIRLEAINYNPESRLGNQSSALLENRKFENIVMYMTKAARYIIENYKYLDTEISLMLEEIEKEIRAQ